MQGSVTIDRSVETLIDRYGDRVMGMLRRVLRQEEDAKDAWQDTWFSVWRAILRLEWTRDPWPFIRKTAMRKAIDRIRRGRRLPQLDGIEDIEGGDGGEASALRPTIDLGQLNPEERACLVLFFWEECSVREIATTMGVPSGTVKTWMFRARGKLRRSLSRGDETAADGRATNEEMES